MLGTLSCDGVDDGVRGEQLDGSVGDIRGEVHHGMVWCAGRHCLCLHMHDCDEAGQSLVQVVPFSPGWRVMLSERKAARLAESLWALEALPRSIPGFSVADW
jgi:hypothetical protein